MARARAAPIPPHNLEAEESLLGAMLLSKDAVTSAIEMGLAGAHFYKPSHGHIFDAIMAVASSGDPLVDAVTVADELSRAGLIDDAGGTAALSALQLNTPVIGHVGRYARIVLEHSLLRQMIGVAGEIAETGYSVPEDVPAALDEAEAKVFALRPERYVPQARQLSAALSEFLDTVAERTAAGGAVERPTGWADLDDAIGGLVPGRMIVVAGRPGMGKTSWAGALALNVARLGELVVYVSIEMSEQELVGRLVACDSRIDGVSLLRGRVGERDRNRLDESASRLAALPIEIIDKPGARVLDVATAVRRAAGRWGRLPGLVVVDYLQLMVGRSKAENRQVEVAECARGLRDGVARQLGVPVVALAQLSRGLEARADKRPQLVDLRESGEIENTADCVIGLYRDQMYKKDTEDRDVAELVIIKNRQGPQGIVRLGADMATGRWTSLDRQREF